MLQRLANNWNLKLMSLVLAIALWSHVRGEVNPWETASFRVPLQTQLPGEMVLLNRDKIPQFVKVTLRAPRLRLRELKGFAPPNPLAPASEAPLLSREDVTAHLDFSLARRGRQNVPVRIEARGDDIEVIGKPDDVVAVLDRATSARFPIEPLLAVSRGYEVRDVAASVREARVSGPANVLESIAGVRAPLRSGALNLNRSKTVESTLVAVNGKGEEVQDVLIEPARIRVTARLREQMVTRRLRVEPKIYGPEGDGYEIADVRVTPRSLLVRGPRRVLDDLSNLPVEVRIAGNRDEGNDYVERTDVPLPKSVTAVSTNRVQVRVTVGARPDETVAPPTPAATSTPEPTTAPTPQSTLEDGEPPVRREAF